MGDRKLLGAGDLARILRVYLRIVEELPADTEAGYLDANGHVHFAADIGHKLRASREAAEFLERIRKSDED
ncbi:MAG TPA: hypothetical protein VF502_17610 [Stellaceae bacterium]